MWRKRFLALLYLLPASLAWAASPNQQQALLAQLPAEEVHWISAGENQFLALLRDEVLPPSRGVLLLVPDPAQHADQRALIHHLRREMNKHGWVTLALMPPQASALPSPPQDDRATEVNDELDPTAPPGASATPPPPLTPLAEAWQQRMRAAAELTRVYNGLFVVYAEGRSAAALAELYQREALETPQALVVKAPFLPEAGANRALATVIAGVPVPVLDLYSRYDNQFAQATRTQRLYLARAAEHPNYRQRELIGTENRFNQAEGLAQDLHSYLSSHHELWQEARRKQRLGL